MPLVLVLLLVFDCGATLKWRPEESTQ